MHFLTLYFKMHLLAKTVLIFNFLNSHYILKKKIIDLHQYQHLQSILCHLNNHSFYTHHLRYIYMNAYSKAEKCHMNYDMEIVKYIHKYMYMHTKKGLNITYYFLTCIFIILQTSTYHCYYTESTEHL